jgi:hypothetical protein
LQHQKASKKFVFLAGNKRSMNDQNKFKHQELNALWEEYKETLLNTSLQYYSLSIEELRNFVEAYKTRLQTLDKLTEKASDEILILRGFSSGVLELLFKAKDALLSYKTDQIQASYNTQIAEILKNNSYILPKKEVFRGYDFQTRINIPLFFKKLWANFILSSRTRKKKFYNVFRKLFKKQLLDIQSYRLRKIPYGHMIEYYIGQEYSKQLWHVLGELFLVKSEIAGQLWDFDDTLNQKLQSHIEAGSVQEFNGVLMKEEFEKLLQEMELKIQQFETSLKNKLEASLFEAFQRFDADFAIVDTPDLPTQKFRKKQLVQEQTKIITSYDSLIEKWGNTHLALLDDWSLDVDVMLLYFSVLNEFKLLNNQISDYINDNLSLNLGKLREFVNASAKRIESTKTLTEQRKLLKEERVKNSEDFIDKMLAKTINKLSGKINIHLESFNKKTMKLVEQVSNKRAIVKGRNYIKETKTSDIRWLAPRDLLNFEALPHFNQAIEEVEKFVEQHLEKARIKLIALGTVSDFSLESALMMLDEKKGSIKGSQQVVRDGYHRALIHLDEAEELMGKIKQDPLENLQTAINNFNIEIQKLKNTENVLELQMKIVKIRAVERSKKMRKEAWEWVVHFIPKTREFIYEQFKNTNALYVDLKKKIGINTEKPHISHELSDFLRKTEESLKKLPFVYQRLYQLTPTDEERFFVGRTKELQELKEAYENWQNNRYITTAIIGEKGSGISSLVLYFLKKKEEKLPIIHLELNAKIYQENDYYQFFAKAFGQDSFSSNDEIIQYIHKRKIKSVFIIENLQHLYLKIVKGFACQKMFFDLMTNTWEQIFWIGAYTTHSWEYLEKTIQISSVFIKEIKLERFTDETLEDIIYKRNYLSGYRVEFQVSESSQSNKSFDKMDEDSKQKYLKRIFFKELNQMSNGNVSLAQLYWLRSTHAIDEGVIKIQSLRDFDVSFDKELPSNYLFALHAILVHDGLVISDYAKVFNSPEYICRSDLAPMLEKGLLIKPRDKYNINPIIFRQVVDLLRSHNFIN